MKIAYESQVFTQTYRKRYDSRVILYSILFGILQQVPRYLNSVPSTYLIKEHFEHELQKAPKYRTKENDKKCPQHLPQNSRNFAVYEIGTDVTVQAQRIKLSLATHNHKYCLNTVLSIFCYTCSSVCIFFSSPDSSVLLQANFVIFFSRYYEFFLITRFSY